MGRIALYLTLVTNYKMTEEKIGTSPESLNDLDNNDDIPNEGILIDNEDQTENEYARRSNLYILDKSKSRMGLYLHTSSTQKGISYSCKYCRYKASYKSDLKKHQKSIHKGVKY